MSNLWSIRNFWEWLAPGIGVNRDSGLASAAFITYENLSNYRDFLIQQEQQSSTGSARSVGSVGLSAKQFMTDPDYTYMGTLTNHAMFHAVVTGVPPATELTVSPQKTRREAAVRKVFERLQKGPYQEQFSPARLADVRTPAQLFWSTVSLAVQGLGCYLPLASDPQGHGPSGPPVGAFRELHRRHAT